MWIVKLALRRPYTFIVLAIVIVLLGVFTILRTPTDIFPNIRIPVVATVWNYSGLSPEEMATRLVLFSERTAQTTVNDVEHTESQSLTGIAVVKYFFQPNVNEELSFAQITGVSQTQLRAAPPGTTPPFILAYNASSVPILQLALSSQNLSEAQLFDQGNNIIRTALATVPGASMPYPYGGLQRQVQVDLDPDALRAQGLSGSDVTAAIAAQNLIIPAGTEKIGGREYFIAVNSNPRTVEELNELPVTSRNGSVIYVRDVAHVRDGYPPQTNIVRRDGHRGVLMSVLKTGSASTLDIIKDIKGRMPRIRNSLPDGFHIDLIGDQSVFVRAAISGVVREAVIAAALTALMILLFLGSWRSTVIIAISIPLSILASIICLSALGETINIMTLGGLALAVGILVDDATVTIENINWHLEHGEDVEAAILNGAHEIAVPALVSTLAICIVFVPMFMLAGIARFLFVPLAEAVVFAMLASYALSRTLIPTLGKYWLQRHDAQARNCRRGHCWRATSRPLRSGSYACAHAMSCSSGRRSTPACASPCRSSAPWRPPRCSLSPSAATCPGWARTSSRALMPARSSCTSAHRPASALTRPRRCVIASRRASARSSRPGKSPPSSTTSACPTAASTSPTRPPRPWAPEMPTFL